MKETTQTPDDDLLQQLRALHYPNDIDVVDAVMYKVRKTPLLVSDYRQTTANPYKNTFRRIAVAVAACAVIAVAINVVNLYTRSYNEAQISDVIASVYNYQADYGSSSLYHESIVDEYLYQ